MSKLKQKQEQNNFHRNRTLIMGLYHQNRNRQKHNVNNVLLPPEQKQNVNNGPLPPEQKQTETDYSLRKQNVELGVH